MNQIEINLTEGKRRRDEGIERAADKVPTLLEVARVLARRIANMKIEVTADDVAKEMQTRGYPPLGRAAGALFRGKEWEFTGRYVASEQAQNHAHPIKVWRLK